MRIGRNWTNLLNFDYMDEGQKKSFLEGKLTVPDMDATIQGRLKRDVKRQIDKCVETGLQHVELDGGIPNPYLQMPVKELETIKQYAEKKDITLSLHLPYTFTAIATCGFQEEDRIAAVDMLKRYIDVAHRLGCRYCVMHPGSIPYYQATGKYLDISNAMLTKSLLELGHYTRAKDMYLHMENNTKFDSTHIIPEDSIGMLEEIWDKAQVKYCFDLAHTFTVYKHQSEIPLPVEAQYEKIPAKFYYAIHIGDFVPEKALFHPPLFRESGVIKRETWKNIFRLFRRKGVQYVVIETAVREREDMIEGDQLQREEAAWIKSVFDEVMAEPAPELEEIPSKTKSRVK
ncbi:MAG TPA: sugar phosphate isomerase/epimerase family protein [Elusimicrobiota bacterium]|nr:sugar phosphate isomerase/epimerase family protein [Elusimicrobiota bacterium]